MTEKVLWHQTYGAAMLELDPTKLEMRIAEARAAIQRREEELASGNHTRSAEEGQQMADALSNLQALHRLEFGHGHNNAANAGVSDGAGL